jgi:hypothetical protein
LPQPVRDDQYLLAKEMEYLKAFVRERLFVKSRMEWNYNIE